MYKENDSPIHLAICLDINYLQPFWVLITSIFINNKHNKIIIHSIVTAIQEQQKVDIINYINQYGGVIYFYKIDDSIFDNLPFGGWTKAMYYRLYIPSLLADTIEKVIYLDTDIVVIGNLANLYNVVLGNYPVAAVSDGYGSRPDLGIFDKWNYFNSGVLLMNLFEWRNQQITLNALEYIKKYPFNIIYGDQCALNAVLVKNWKKLDIRYNLSYNFVSPTLSKQMIDLFLKDKIIIHFTTIHKPWKATCNNRLRFLYFKYLHKTPLKAHSFVYHINKFKLNDLNLIIKIRLTELYFDHSLVRNLWGKMKKLFY